MRVDGGVAGLAQAVEQVEHSGVDDPAVAEPARGRGEVVLGGVADARVGGGLLGEQLGELAEPDQGEVGVLEDEPLGLGAVPHEQRVVGGEEGEVGRLGRCAGGARPFRCRWGLAHAGILGGSTRVCAIARDSTAARSSPDVLIVVACDASGKKLANDATVAITSGRADGRLVGGEAIDAPSRRGGLPDRRQTPTCTVPRGGFGPPGTAARLVRCAVVFLSDSVDRGPDA